MNKIVAMIIILASVTLTACSSFDNWNGGSSKNSRQQSKAGTASNMGQTSNEPMSNPAAQKAVGGHAARAMDSIDRSKLWHALDKPIGRATSWVNASTGMNYTVVPTQKITINGNNFCRKYQVTARVQGGGSNVTEGTACVGPDGNWEAVNS